MESFAPGCQSGFTSPFSRRTSCTSCCFARRSRIRFSFGPSSSSACTRCQRGSASNFASAFFSGAADGSDSICLWKISETSRDHLPADSPSRERSAAARVRSSIARNCRATSSREGCAISLRKRPTTSPGFAIFPSSLSASAIFAANSDESFFQTSSPGASAADSRSEIPRASASAAAACGRSNPALTPSSSPSRRAMAIFRPASIEGSASCMDSEASMQRISRASWPITFR